MKLRDNRALGILLAAVVLVGGANIAVYAANGKPLLLGKGNQATKTTTIKNTGKGAPLTLRGKKSVPPLKVTSKKVVKKLNADLLDGKQAKDFASSAPLVWKPIPLDGGGSWTPCIFPELEVPQYAVRQDVVYLRGGACDGLSIIANLPADARPDRTIPNVEETVAIPLVAATFDGPRIVNVFEDGAIQVQGSAPDYVSFEGLSFTR